MDSADQEKTGAPGESAGMMKPTTPTGYQLTAEAQLQIEKQASDEFLETLLARKREGAAGPA